MRLKFFILLSLLSSLIFAQEISSSKELLDKAKRLYSENKYDSTTKIIKAYLKEHGKEKETEHIVPLLMETLIRMEEYKYFQKLVKVYHKKFPQSKYTQRVHYLTGIVEAKEKNWSDAILSFSEASRIRSGSAIDSLVPANVRKICSEKISKDDLEPLLKRGNLSDPVKTIVMEFTAQNYRDEGNIAKAEAIEQSTEGTSFKRGSGNVNINKDAIYRIGLLAPITGDNADLGKLVEQAARLAVDNYNSKAVKRIELVVMDTKGEMVETAVKTIELIEKHQVSMIIGPVLSSTATVAASIAMNRNDVVIITPTATDDGIAGLGQNIFQMNVTMGILGKKIAQYAVSNLNIHEFAVLAPMNRYGDILTQCFTTEVEKLGAKILAKEYYDEEANDFRPQYDAIREKLAERKWEAMKVDNPEFGESNKDADFKANYLKDSTIAVGGLFIPAEIDDAAKLASQTYFHRVRTQLLGANGWHNNSTILDGKQYVQNAIFSTNLKGEGLNEKFEIFSNLFKQKFDQMPDRAAAPLTYDATNLLISTLEGSRTVSDVVTKLSSVSGFSGVAGLVTFTNNSGANGEAAIMKISGKKFIKVK